MPSRARSSAGRLGDRLALEDDLSRRRAQQADQAAHGRGLSDAVAPDQADDLALGDRHVDAVQDRRAAVAGAQAGDVEHGFSRPWLLPR